MHSTTLIVASLALLAVCACAPADGDVIQHIPLKEEATPSATGKSVAGSGASERGSGASEHRARRDLGGDESDLLPSANEGDASPFGESSQLAARGRIRVLPAFLGRKMHSYTFFLHVATFGHIVPKIFAGISPVHEFKEKINANIPSERFLLNSPHNGLKHLDNSILKATKNVTSNPQMEETLFQLSKDLVSAILSKLEIQDKITRITTEALAASDYNKGITAIETRRILDYISRTLSGHILSITRKSTEPELHRLVYGLGQIAAEVSIVSALKDITYVTALSKKQSVDLSLRKKRSLPMNTEIKLTSPTPIKNLAPTIYDVILNKTKISTEKYTNNTKKFMETKSMGIPISPYAVLSRKEKASINLINRIPSSTTPIKGFLNQTTLDIVNNSAVNETEAILLEKPINNTNNIKVESDTLNTRESIAPTLTDKWMNIKDNVYKPSTYPDIIAEMEFDELDTPGDEVVNEKRTKQKLEKMEVKAKKAILYAGDVAYLTAANVVALRRALTASIEVQMSVRYAKNGMSNHQDLMMNLAKTAAQQAGKEAKGATSKSLACERVIKLALKYTAQSHGAKLNHVANRIVMDTLSLATLAKSMAFVTSDIAINSLYQATDVKPPS